MADFVSTNSRCRPATLRCRPVAEAEVTKPKLNSPASTQLQKKRGEKKSKKVKINLVENDDYRVLMIPIVGRLIQFWSGARGLF